MGEFVERRIFNPYWILAESIIVQRRIDAENYLCLHGVKIQYSDEIPLPADLLLKTIKKKTTSQEINDIKCILLIFSLC